MVATQRAAFVAGRPLTERRPWVLVVLEALTALSAVYGGTGLIEEFIGMPRLPASPSSPSRRTTP